MNSLLRAFILAGVLAPSVVAVASAQDIPTNVTLSCPGGQIRVESCNIRDTSDTSTCLVGHPETIMPNGLMKYTNETRGSLKKVLPNCQKAAPSQASASKANPAQLAANKPKAPSTSASANPASRTQTAPSATPASFNTGTAVTLTSISIQNSPGVPDLGGHSILGGVLRGSLTAVEPNLFLCVTPAGGRRTCTAVCQPGHDCTQPLGAGIRINGANPSVRVEVMDNDKQGHITSLGVADVADPTKCTQSLALQSQSPAPPSCVHTFPDQTSPDPAHGTDSTFYFDFEPVGCSVRTSPSSLTRSTMTVSGSLPTYTSAFAAVVAQPAPSLPACTMTFTSYSNDITSQQLLNAFLSLWGNGSALMPGSQLFRSNLGKIPAPIQVNVLVVDTSDSQFPQMVGQASLAYSFFNAHYKNKSGQTSSYRPPQGNEFAFTVPPDPHPDPKSKQPPAISVVISAQFLENAYYPTTGVDDGLSTAVNDLPLPIQLTLAYELGSNAFGIATQPKYQEHPRQTTTNCIMEQAFGGGRGVGGQNPHSVEPFAPSIMTDDQGHPTTSAVLFRPPRHGIYDELAGGYFQPTLGGPNSKPQTIFIYSNATSKYGTLPDIYLPPAPSASKTTSKIQSAAPLAIPADVITQCEGVTDAGKAPKVDLGPPAQIVSPPTPGQQNDQQNPFPFVAPESQQNDPNQVHPIPLGGQTGPPAQ
jgi:hypothetical protein